METYIVEGKYTTGLGSKWERLDTITPEEGGREEAYRLCREYIIAAPYAQHRVRPLRDTDDS